MSAHNLNAGTRQDNIIQNIDYSHHKTEHVSNKHYFVKHIAGQFFLYIGKFFHILNYFWIFQRDPC